MVTDFTELVENPPTETTIIKNEVPFTLREFGEVPEGFVPVFITVKKDSLNYIAENGFRVLDNRMGEKKPKLESIFGSTAKDMGINNIDRTKCVFAYPRHPDKIGHGWGDFNPEEQVLIQAMIDPRSGAVVADGKDYTEASTNLDSFIGEKGARAWAKSYWEGAITLQQYLEEKHGNGSDDEFILPEVLIPYNIPTSRLKVISN